MLRHRSGCRLAPGAANIVNLESIDCKPVNGTRQRVRRWQGKASINVTWSGGSTHSIQAGPEGESGPFLCRQQATKDTVKQSERMHIGLVSSPKFCVDVEIFLKLWILLFHDWLRSLHRDRKNG